jgi:hypothetical protein
MKLFTVDFDPVWPVPCALVILAHDMDEAERIALSAIKHEQSEPIKITEHDINKPGVVLYESGDY